MGIQNKDGALFFATGIDNTGLYSGRREAMGIIKAMASEITSFDVFGGIGISAGIAFAKAAKSAYDFEKQFQQSMKEVATLSSGIKGSLTDYMNQVMDLIRTVPVEASEAAKALYQIVSAGHDGADGMRILEVSAKAAIGGVTDTATAADAITTVLNAYKMDASKAQEVSDLLFTTVRLGKTDFGQLGRSIAQAAPIAASFGIDIKEILAAVASVTKQGVPTSEAMTKIRAAILGTANQLGDAAFKGRTFQEALQLIYDKANGSSTAMKELLGTDEALQAALMLTGEKAKEAAADLTEVSNSVGAAEAAFKEMASSAENQLKLLGNNIVAVLRPLGEGMLKEISRAAQSMNEAFADGSAQGALKDIGALIVVVTTALAGYKGSILAVNIAKQISAGVTALVNRQRVIEAANLVLTKGMYAAEATMIVKNTSVRILLTKAIKAQTIAQLKNATAMLTNPYVLAAAAFAALGYAIYNVVTAETEAEKATRMYNEALDEQQKKQDEYKEKIDNLIKTIDDNNKSEGERLQAFEALKAEYPTILNNLLTEAEYLKDVLKYKKLIAEEDNKRVRQDDADLLVQEESKLEKLKLGIDKLKAIYGNDETHLKIKSSIDAYNAQLEVVNKQKSKVASHDGASFLGNIKNMKDDDITSAIDGINNSLKALEKSGDEAIAVVTELGGEFSKSQLSSIKNALETEQNARNTEKNTGKGWIEKYKKSYLDAKDELDKFLNSESELSEIEYERKLKELTNKKDEAEKKYKASGGKVTIDKNVQTEAAKQKQLLQKLSDDLLSLRHKNQQKEVSLMQEGREKKLRQIAADFEAEETEIRKRSREFADANKKKGTTGLNSYGLTPEQQAEIDKANRLNADSRAKAESDVYKAEAQAMRDYLKEYGTFQQQKLAIAEEYAEKIKKAQSESERKTLEKQRDSALLNVDVKAARQEIDWQSVFGDLGLMLKEQVQPTIDNLKKIIQSEQFQNSSIEDQQKIYEILSQMEKQSGTFGRDMFKEVARDLELYRNSLNAYHAAQEREIEASENLAKAKEKLKDAQENGGDVKSARQAVDEAQEAFDRASESVRTFGEKATENASTLQSSSEKVRGALEGFASGLEQLKSGSLSQAFEGIKGLGKTLGGKLGDAISKIDPTGIIGGVLAIMDVLKDGVSSIFVSLQDTMYGMIEGVLDDLFSGDILTKPLTNAFSHMGNILNTVTFGGFDSWFNIGGNAKETAEKIERLTASNDALKTSIDNLKEELEGSNGTKSIEAYNEAVDAQKRYNENLRQILDAQMRYNAAHHSNSYYWNLDKNSLSQVNRLLGTSLKNTWSAFSQLTAEQMNEIRTHLPDVWREMVNQGKYGDRFKEDWDNYADQAGKVVEMTDSLRENLAQISFDSLRDSFVDALMDMDASAEDFADNFEEYMTRSLLNFAVGDNIDEKMKLWYESWTNTMNAQHGRLTEKQIEDYRAQWNGFVEEGIKTRDEIAGLTGYQGSGSSSSTATTKGFAAMSQDTGKELNGRFTALQISNEEIKNQAIIQTGLQQAMLQKLEFLYSFNYTSTTEINDIVFDILDVLSEMKKDTAHLYFIKESLNKIEKNTKGLISK